MTLFEPVLVVLHDAGPPVLAILAMAVVGAAWGVWGWRRNPSVGAFRLVALSVVLIAASFANWLWSMWSCLHTSHCGPVSAPDTAAGLLAWCDAKGRSNMVVGLSLVSATLLPVVWLLAGRGTRGAVLAGTVGMVGLALAAWLEQVRGAWEHAAWEEPSGED